MERRRDAVDDGQPGSVGGLVAALDSGEGAAPETAEEKLAAARAWEGAEEVGWHFGGLRRIVGVKGREGVSVYVCDLGKLKNQD